jgi:hypothetical protein
MSRPLAVLLLLVRLAGAQGIEVEKPPPPVEPGGFLLETQLRRGQRFTGANTVAYSATMTTRQGQKETTESESVERTERFVDQVLRSETHGVLEIERTYTKLFTKARTGDEARPDVYQSPLQGQKVQLRERAHRRDLRVGGRGTIEPLVRRTAGMEIDWRDIFPEDPVRPGDAWDADAAALSRALGAYLNCGTRARMRVRFEEVLERNGSKQAKLYVDWTLEGMRDKNLFTKVTLAGDVYFDLGLQRVVAVDLTGSMIIRGAIIGTGAPRIVKGEGQVLMKSSLKTAEIDAAPEEEPGDDAEGEQEGN